MKSHPELDRLHARIRACTLCKAILPPESKPLFQGNGNARIVVISQAPSRLANQLRKKWADNLSGKTLRAWFGVPDDIFWDENIFYLTALGKCYPGKGTGGDRLPPPICAQTWLEKELLLLQPSLIVTVGGRSFSWFFPDKEYDASMNAKTLLWNGLQVLALPHPSGANNRWKSQNKERLECIIGELRRRTKMIVKAALDS